MWIVAEGMWPLALMAVSLALLLAVGPAMGMPPLALIQKENLAAAEILIGQVEELQAPAGTGQAGIQARQGLFTLRVSHVVKSDSGIQAGRAVSVVFGSGPPGPPPLGGAVVRVAPGDLVIVYANPAEGGGTAVLNPVRGGFSVVRLGPPPKPGEAVRAPGLKGE
jgi:hypothetical protein